ncbi:MAG TPA: galactose oxidase-like domain-containing protein [Gemmatimonadales bacterium]|nr:galactose oxidase-like domain-containing protein [Gemmatimonadales bacterium]
MRPHLKFTLATTVLLGSCVDSAQSPQARPEPPSTEEAPGSNPQPIDLVYVCGNKFLAINGTTSAVHVTYRVVGTQETGGLTLREGTGGDPGFSETELETSNGGPVELYRDDEKVVTRQNENLSCGASAISAAVAAVGTEATTGRWSAPFTWLNIGLHLHLLRTGKVLSWGKFGQQYVWTPSTNTFTVVSSPDWLFCSGHTFLSDGRLLVNGGHISDHVGLKDANLFNPGTMAWESRPSMAYGRWYPTTTTLGNGQAVTISGEQNGALVTVPEVWTGSGWRSLTSASRVLPNYPRTFLAPNGKVFYAGENRSTAYLSTSGSGSWSAVASRRYGVRDYGSAVMYQPGKVLYVGGGRTTNTAEIIDLNQAAPAWQWTGSMAHARRQHNATILPTGQVLVLGGTSGTAFSDESRAVYAAELWDPKSGTWTTLASNRVPRVYHSTALLLKDGRVLLTGSGDADGSIDHFDAELFSPPYLFKGTRPKISSAPSTVGYGQSFFVETSSAASITRVTLVRLGSVTHAFDSNQRFNELSFVRTSTGLNVTAPDNRNLAPPGHYLLFILNGKEVPSVARVLRIR